MASLHDKDISAFFDLGSNQFARKTLGVDSLVTVEYDAGTVTRPNSLTEVYQFRVGGIAGTIVQTITIVYVNASKTDIASWERS